MANSQNAWVAQSIDGGVMHRGPLGTPLPGAAVETAPSAALKDQGTCAQDGLSIGITRTSNTVKDFDGADFIDIQTEYNGEFKIKLLEFDLEDVKRTSFGDANVTFTPANGTHGNRYHVAHNPDQLPLSTFLFRTKYGKKRKNFEIAIGRVTEVAEFKLESGDATGLELTVKAFRNPATGNFVDEYGDDGALVPGPLNVTVVATGAWRFGVGGQLSAPLTATSTNSEVKTAIEAIAGVTGTVNVTGSTAGTYSVSLSDGGTVSVDGAATLS
ncbi:hypothetical protein [Gordonia malaquae]|uniref:hypothetical protein n=1 Tax=Gordonia malaquae TaxID=410332 RepID=UPI0030FE4C88